MAADGSTSTLMESRVSLEYIVGYAGLCAAFATALALLSVYPGATVRYFDCVPANIVVAFTMAAGFLVISILQEKIARMNPSPLVIGEFAGFAAYVVYIPFSHDAAIALPLLVVASLAASALLSTWFCWTCAQDKGHAPFLVAGGCLVACLMCLLELRLDEVARAATIAGLALASSVVVCVLRERGAIVNRFPVIPSAESDSRSRITPESTLKLSIDSFNFGLVVAISFYAGAQSLCLLSAGVAALVFIVDKATVKIVTERVLGMLAPPLAVAAICSLFLFGPAVQKAALALMSALFCFATCVGWLAMVGHVRMSRLSPLRIFPKGRRYQYLACTIGLGAGLLLCFLAQGDWVLAVRVSVGLAVVVCLAFSVLHKSRFPEVGLEDEGGESGGDGSSDKPKEGRWRKRCRAFCEANELSERQAEVLVLIAQGRSIEHVSQQLFISTSTVQTHVRNIYRKTGVHSRTELVDEIEATKLYGEE